ncbi:hypothetical protein BSZ35_07340 [Salinibacter sp. 10B]|uniref:FG-GAP repeat domain-containing protein n=1 Tax=Salinibacter sp. 10B TaxID=1923971 RepID=UPI000CF47D7B|nr:VCBS repeat-containing protein [Salinibacter sp. 10B]PQJ34438.1 hypothetical protein BSZ35_07340 [Salinibacter sp. 10B]
MRLHSLLFLLFLLSCTQPDPSANESQSVRDGRRLANQHCWTCHTPASPSTLDKETWTNGVLPAMAPKLGIQVMWDDNYYKPDARPDNTPRDSVLSLQEWRKIVAYFRAQAPDSVTLPPPPATLRRSLPLFSIRTPPPNRRRSPSTAMVAIDTARHRLYTSTVSAGRLARWSPSFERTPLELPPLKGVETQFVRDSTGARQVVFTGIGTMRAVNSARGRVERLNVETGRHHTIADQLPRPVCARPGDFNQDGRRDWLVCGFGHDRGGLYLFEQQPDGTYRKRVLRSVPGAVDAQIGDFNDDGWTDAMVLFGHSKEGVWLFLNDGTGHFVQKSVVRFPPHYGSSSLQVVDFNGDERPDLLYTSGDNADYSTILKPFHGAYIYINTGDFQYEKRFFYHFNGATEAVARDFDEDGDLDIGMIGFFADLRSDAAQDFVYLEQDGPLEFTPHAPPIAHKGRWISMDAGDYDGDNDVDLVLGNFPRRYSSSRRTTDSTSSRPPFLILENQLRAPTPTDAPSAE